VRRSHDDVSEVRFVHEQLGLDHLGEPELDRFLLARGHDDPAVRGKLPADLDALDIGVPLRPPRHVSPQLPDRLGRRARLDAVLGRPHRRLLRLR
jgi:hypothetical protein